jgi:hypothetical protein
MRYGPAKNHPRSDFYVVSEGVNGPVKVGRSINAAYRLCALQTGNPRPLRLIFKIDLTRDEAIVTERAFLTAFRKRAMTGEWLDLSEELILSWVNHFMEQAGIEVPA